MKRWSDHLLKVPDIQFREKLVNENFEISIDLLVDTLFIAPLLGTFIFQYLFFFIFTKFNVNRWVLKSERPHRYLLYA